MKLNKSIFAISLGAAMVIAALVSVGMTSVPKPTSVAGSSGASAPIILASAQPHVTGAGATQPMSIPVPCPIWLLGQIAGYGKTQSQSADSAKPSVEMVPGGIWFMQKFSDAVRKAI